MTEQEIKDRARLIGKKDQFKEALLLLSRTANGTIRVNYNEANGLIINRESFLKFLQGEIQDINLELHNLGVELPGVPEIGAKQAVTKGNDI